MSSLIALYLPNPVSLQEDLLILFLVLVAIVGFGLWFPLNLKITIPLSLLGAVAALTPEILRAMHGDFGSYGYDRNPFKSEYSTAFLNIVAYFHVGRGKLIGAAGMLAPTLIRDLDRLASASR